MAKSDLNHQTMKQLLKKFSNSELFVLSEAAHYLKVSESYLLDLIKHGKIKAFKVDNHWFVEEKWLLDFKKNLRQHLVTEKTIHGSLSHKEKPWTRRIIKPSKKSVSWSWKMPLLWFSQSLLLAVISIGLAFLFIPLGKLNSQKRILANYFLSGVAKVYSWPVDLISTRPVNGAINDEVLTQTISDIWTKGQNQELKPEKNDSGPKVVKPSSHHWPK